MTTDSGIVSIPTPTVDALTGVVTSTMLADVITDTGTLPSATSSTSDTLIHITALPPANSSTSITRTRNASLKGPSKPFNVAYLAPLFAILGGIAGALCTWLLYRFVPKRSVSRQRETLLEPGPRYTPPSMFRHTTTLTPAPLEDEDPARPSQASARPLLDDSVAEEKKKGSWLARAFSTRSRAAPKLVEQRSESAEAGDEAEDDPFLARSLAAGTPAAPAGGLGRHATTRTTFSYGALGDEEELAPYDTLRHKSIRRGILERLRMGTVRRPPAPAEYERGETEDDSAPGDIDASPSARLTGKRRGHRREDSDMKVADMRSRTTSTEDSVSRRPTLSRNRSDLVVSPPGFRLVLEDPISGALMSAPPSCNTSPTKEESSAWGLSFPWQPSPTKPRAGDDKFTALPVRRSQADKRSPYASPSPSSRALSVLSASEDEDAVDAHNARSMPPLSRIDSSILPASPPMVRSPPLDSQLFFGSFGSSPSLDLRLPPPVPSKHDEPSRSTPPGEKRAKLRTQRSPPALPFPSTASTSPFRGRLKKTPTKRAAPVAAVARNESADSVDGPTAAGGRGTPAQRHEARGSALNKVSEILSRGWGERHQVGGGDGPRSPFLGSSAHESEPLSGGASLEKLVDEEAMNGMGIEQRLGALRGV
ncbi:uncharacterized protein TRAVEDRAFT_24124 [Trametes versicolor FP-101664 SS1]|uniref:uncharacterized protein n=1 Tax=Trametes versicolor (strain FP-101664) TaxID=717944 RepID=UPI000462389A|nr:uncharacterized protein TRAVEDRAFT_24124 [Trametes versicolor FP-101664 SS1]EIW52664.1 hypothetical protein TRAVEDRAFT_24124 [Trametes versicolor FP-101664 SS1]